MVSLSLNQWVQGSSPWEDTKKIQIAENVQFTRNVYCTFFRIYMPIISKIGAIHTRFGTLSTENLLQNCNKSVTQTQIGNKTHRLRERMDGGQTTEQGGGYCNNNQKLNNMAKLSINLDDRGLKNGMAQLRLRITHKNTNAQVGIAVYIEPQYYIHASLYDPIHRKAKMAVEKRDWVAEFVRKADEWLVEIDPQELERLTAKDIKDHCSLMLA